MRPHRFFACRNDLGEFTIVLKGQAAARAYSGGTRSYVSFRTQIEAEEYAAWWNYEAPQRAAEWKAAFDKQMAQRKERWAKLGATVSY